MRGQVSRLRGKLRNFRHRLRRFKAYERIRTMDFTSGLGDLAWLLYGLARSLKPKVCVEIGSARGKSACFIGMAHRENNSGKLYAIDPHTATNWNDSDSVETIGIMKDNIHKVALNSILILFARLRTKR
jgi:predicted O-methyltransferase YrrM